MGRRRMRPEAFHGLVALGLTLLLAAAFVVLLRRPDNVYYLLLAWLLAINLVTFGYYGYDKGQAGGGGRRVPELVLHALVYLGGTLGGYLGMRIFRHKTMKGPFRLVFWFIVVLQVALLAALVYRLRAPRQAAAGEQRPASSIVRSSPIADC